jgi:hypothetical protein
LFIHTYINKMEQNILTLSEIKRQYPSQWVLIGNPKLNNDFVGSVISKLISGVVLLGSKDRREIAYKAKDLRKGFEHIACVYTGEIPKNRKYLL